VFTHTPKLAWAADIISCFFEDFLKYWQRFYEAKFE
jgi:hypothetical protein